ncbi:hypothetical protein VE00_10774 [Pseudogymnoascus sp. WSF 3629]|nr:hypothetical protein VE00_10774 [Pseudogymnoascus sp. WSF 3629]
MPKALKEEYVPYSWEIWRERGQPQQELDVTTAFIDVPVDIIAVQGLASTYESTWTHKLSDGTSVMWLRDLLPVDLPDARIMSFEYDSNWLHNPSFVKLKDCGDRLLESIIWDRTHKGGQKMCPIMARRPLILLGHSFGGLVIKQVCLETTKIDRYLTFKALVTAANAKKNHPKYEDYQSVITAVAGVMFLGTPHNGSNFASAGLLQAYLKRFLGHATNVDILRPLVVKSTLDALDDLEENFQNILEYEDRVSMLMSTYFYETKPLNMGPFESKLVVERDSACYGSKSSHQVKLEANHMQMNKFSSRNESNYTRLVECLSDFHRHASRIVEARLGKYQYNSQNPGGNVMEIRRWLSPETTQNDVYERRQADRLDGTCEWAYHRKTICTWLDINNPSDSVPPADGRAVWVSGKAGSGKSVFAVYLYDQTSRMLRKNNWSATDVSRCSGSSETIDLLYFPISKSSTPASTIRTLIHQLLCFQPTSIELQKVVIDEKGGLEECTSKQGIRILSRLLRHFPLTHIIIDGLDECDKPKDLVEPFKDIGQLHNVCLLFLARQDEELEHIALRHIPGLQMVDIADYNGDDILDFIQTKVFELARINNAISAEADSVVQLISLYACGMFQWVHIVLYALHFAKTKDDVFSTIDRFPRELNEAYENTFHRLSQAPGFELDISVLVLKLLSAAYRSLNWEELAMAVQLQKELDSHRQWDAQTLQDCIDIALQKSRALPHNYFSFLGPLVDIKLSSANNEHPTEPGTTISRLARTVAICHHSLYQWIEGSETSVNRAAPWWEQVHFTRTEAHKTSAGLSLVMLSSRSMLSRYLQDFYNPSRSATPLLNYSGTYWFAHVRAVGASTTFPHLKAGGQHYVTAEPLILSDLTQMMLIHSMDIVAGVCAALSSSLEKINVQNVHNLTKVIALRSLKIALLPASESIASVKKALPDLSKVIQKPQLKRAAMLRNHQDSTAHDTTSGSLGPKLDSDIALQILTNMRRSRKRQIELLCQAARNSRQLAILLAVDPIRAWTYAQIGDSGISPLVALAHASEAIDTYLAASLLAPELFSHYDMADQFSAQRGHRDYGLLSAARHELTVRDYNGFDSAFYRENIMEHYRISKWEWNRTRMLLAAMQMSSVDPYGMDSMLRLWVTEHSLYSRESIESWMPAIQIVRNVPFQKIRGRAINIEERFLGFMSAAVVFLFKYLTFVCPPLEDVFVSARMYFLLVTTAVRPTVSLLFSNRNDFLVAFCFYLLRCRYAPWILGSARITPWTDLKGIFVDPKGYSPAAHPYVTGWMGAIVFAAQHVFILFLMIDDLTNAYEASTGDIFPESLRRRTSFRLNWTNSDASSILQKFESALKSHSFHWFATFRRIIFIEMAFLRLSYLVFDLVHSAAAAATSTLWSWKSAINYALKLAGYVYGRSSGIVESIKWIARSTFWIYLLDRYQEKSLAGLFYRHIVHPALTFLSNFFQGSIQALANQRDACLALLDSLETLVIQAVKQLDFRSLVFSTAAGICFLGFVFWYAMNDPLSLQSAARSCSKAGDVAKKATSIENPTAFLKWKANETDQFAMITFRGSLNDLDGEI